MSGYNGRQSNNPLAAVPFRGYNPGWEEAPSEGIGQITALDASTRVATIRKTTESAITTFVIFPRAIAGGRTGSAFYAGTHRVRLTLKPGETVTAKLSRIAPRRNSWYAELNDLGTMQVEQVVGEATNGGAEDIVTTVVARIDRRRGDQIYITSYDLSISKPFEEIVFGDEYSLTTYGEPPGVVVVQEA